MEEWKEKAAEAEKELQQDRELIDEKDRRIIHLESKVKKRNARAAAETDQDGLVAETKRKLLEASRVQKNDSKMIMQLCKKLESLLFNNEALRKQNQKFYDV